MLALPDVDVLDALDCDVVTVSGDVCTNAFDEPERWHHYEFAGRLDARVMEPEAYSVRDDGTIVQTRGKSVSTMPPRSYVFDTEHAGQGFDIGGELAYEDLEALDKRIAAAKPDEARLGRVVEYCRRVRESTGRAVMFSGLSAGLGYYGGIPNWSMLCMADPGYVSEFHDIVTRHAAEAARTLVPRISGYVDVLMLSADDQGLQTGPILPPDRFAELFVPYYKRVNEAVHSAAPKMKTFLHSCGAIYDLIDPIIESGFDALNPVQWSAGSATYRQWKDRARNRICLWGGGVNTQHTLPLASVEEVRREVREVVGYMKEDSGYIFCAIHNLLAEIPSDKVVAIYEEATRA
jgi:uroporphyrinogen decarboxylase